MTQSNPAVPRKFVLLGLAVVVAAMIGSLALLFYRMKSETGRTHSTLYKMSMLRECLSDYQKTCDAYPANLEQLLGREPGKVCAKWQEDTCFKQLPQDAWGNDFSYHSDGKTYELETTGPKKIRASSSLPPAS